MKNLKTSGQSIIEYVIIFAIVAAVSVALVANLPKIFNNYVSTASVKMTGVATETTSGGPG